METRNHETGTYTADERAVAVDDALGSGGGLGSDNTLRDATRNLGGSERTNTTVERVAEDSKRLEQWVRKNMKQEPTPQPEKQEQASGPYIPVALGEIGRQIRLSMPLRTSAEANAQADRVRKITDKRRAEMIAARGDRPPKCTLEMEIKKTPNL